MIIWGAADLHLRETIWRSRRDVSGDAYAAWGQLIGMVLKDPGAILLLGGDVFHTHAPSSMDELAFATGMRRLMMKGHAVYGVAGNHDDEDYYRPQLFGMEILPEGEAVEVGGITVAGIPYHRSAEQLAQALADAPACDILVMHAGFRHLLGFEEACQCEQQDIPEHVGMVLNGHVHVYNVTGKVYSPGSLSPNSVSEFGAGHGAFRIDTEKTEVVWHPIHTRHFVTVRWDDAPPSIACSIGGRLPVINLIYNSTQTAAVETFKQENEGRALFLDNVQNLETVTGLEMAAVGEGLDIEGVVRESLGRRLSGDAEASRVALELTRTENPALWLEQFLGEHHE